MAKLVYSSLCSLDGYIADEHGNFDWAEPDAEVHSFINELEREAKTHLYGRKMYEMMTVWETGFEGMEESPPMREFAQIWRAADKIVYSTTLEQVSTPRTRLERTFEPETVRRLKESASGDLLVGGSTLAAHVFRAGLVDELQLFLAPIIVGGGTPTFPTGVRLGLALLDQRRFKSGFVYLHYRAA
ncbi:MAG TPA: dihydrofolate reductase family protein [Aggregicoccus sp.]|nr:dihydrofolate reductase family protein [Aggregicoccus sp.]